MTKGQGRVRRLRTAGSVVASISWQGARRSRGDLLAGTALAAMIGCGLFGFSAPSVAQVSGVTGGVVVGGQAKIANTVPGQVTITQSTPRGVIDWRSFSIGAGERVDFVQPGASSVTLNRVTGPDPSVIAGRLTATGQLILVNGAGVVFANGAQVNAAGLVAATANVADPQRFMQGGPVDFNRPSANPNAGVTNAGTITVREGGLVGLAGNTASNSGTINARLGRVTIGGAETFTIDLAGDGLISFQLGNPVSRQPLDAQGKKVALASNTGSINADGGVVTMTARAARGVVDNVVNAGGTINARAVRNEGGVVVFGADDGTVNVGGAVDVSGAGTGQRGGRVVATAARGTVKVASTASINASGDIGGGRVEIGGSRGGTGPVANARDTSVASGARVNADAMRRGSGGTVIVWADNATVFGGTVSARGGAQGGNGGFVETSGKDTLNILQGASVTANAPAGTAGLWLMDPTNLTINAALATTIIGTLEGGTSVTTTTSSAGTGNGDITFTAGVTTATSGNSDVTWTIQAHGSVSIGGNTISLAASAGNTANLVIDTAVLAGTASNHSITGSGSVTASNVTLNANISGGSIALTGPVNVGGAGTIDMTTTGGGSISLSGATTAGTVNFASGSTVTINNVANAISTVAGTASTAGGAVNLASGTALAVSGGGINAGTSTVQITTTGATSDLMINGAITATGGVTLTSARGLSLAAAINAGANTLALSAAGSGSITQPGGTVNAATLTVATAGQDATLAQANTITSLGSLALGAGVLSVIDAGGLTVAGAITATGGITLTTTGVLSINSTLNSGTSDVVLTGTSITQTAGGAITASGLAATSTSGAINLAVATSAVTTFAANATGGTVGLLEGNGFSVGSVAGINGITATSTASLRSGGSITQTHAISAVGVSFASAGDVSLNVAANNFGTISGTAAGPVTIVNSAPLTVGPAGIASGGNTIDIAAAGALAIDGALSAGVGNVILTAAGGSITQTAIISAAGLAVTATGAGNNVTLGGGPDNQVATFAASATGGGITFGELNGFQIGTVGSLSGITALNTTTLSSGGAITQGTAAGERISTGTLAVATSNDAVTLTNPSNAIANLGAVSLGSGAFTLVNTGNLAIAGAFGDSGDARITTSGALDISGTISIGNSDLVLIANGGDITQTAGASIAATSSISMTASGSILLGANVNTGSATLSLTSGTTGIISQTGGVITSGALIVDTQANPDVGDVTIGSTGSSGQLNVTAGSRIAGNLVFNVGSRNVRFLGTAGGTTDVGGSFSTTGAMTGASNLRAAGGVAGSPNVITASGAGPDFVLTAAALPAPGTDVTIVLTRTGFAAANPKTGSVAVALLPANSIAGPITIRTRDPGISAGATTNYNLVQAIGLDFAGRSITIEAGTALGAVSLNHAGNTGDVTFVFSGSNGTAATNILTSGNLTVSGTTASLTTNSASLTFAAPGMDVAGAVNVTATNDVTQSASAPLSAASLAVTSTTGSVLLESTANSVGTFSASAPAAGQSVRYRDADALVVAGIVTDAATGIVSLRSENAAGAASGAITQTGGITASQLLVHAPRTGGSVALDLSFVANNVQTIAGVTAGDFTLFSIGALTVGTVLGTSGVQSTGGSARLVAAGGTLTVSSAVDGAMNVGLAAAGSILIGANVTAGTPGMIELFALSSVTQTTGVLAGGSLNVNGDNGISLTQANNIAAGGTVALNAPGGSVAFSNANGFAIGTLARLPGSAPFALATTAGITTVAGGVTSLVAAGEITQGPLAGERISTGTLNVTTTGGGSATLDNAANLVTALGTVTSAGGFTLVDSAAGLTVTGLVSATGSSGNGSVSIRTAGGNLSVDRDVASANGDVTLTTDQFLLINSSVVSANDLTGTVTLSGATGVLNFGGTIFAANLAALSSGGSVSLGGGNDVNVIAGTAAGFFFLADVGGFQVGTVGTVSGIMATTDVSLTAASGNISQTSAGAIAAGTNLFVTTTSGSVLLDTAVNNVATGSFSAPVGQIVRYRDADGFAATVNAIGGPLALVALHSENAAGTASGVITQTGAIDAIQLVVRAPRTGGSAILNNAGNTAALVAADVAGDLTYVNSNASGLFVTTVDTLAGITSTGTVTLIAIQGNVAQSGSGVIAAGALAAISVAANVLLGNAVNDVGAFAATSATGFAVRFRDANSFDVASISGVNGITGTLVALQSENAGGTVSGAITQSAPVTATDLVVRAPQTGGSVMLTNLANAVTTIAGVATGDFAYIDANALTVGSVDGVSNVRSTNGAVALTTRNGGALALIQAIFAGTDITLTSADTLNLAVDLTAGANGVIVLTATSGAISQTTGRISGGSLAAVAVGDINLASASNNVATLAGRSTSGTFRYRDATGFTVGSVANVDGVTTNNRDIGLHAANGDLVLDQSVDAREAAASTTAVVRLQSTGGGITQNGATSSVIAGTLLANALGAGDVVLTSPTNAISSGGGPGLVVGTSAGDFRVVSGTALTITNVAVPGDSGLAILGAQGITAAAGRAVQLSVGSGDLRILGPVSAPQGVIIYQRLATAPAGNIVIGSQVPGPDFTLGGNGIGGARLVIVDNTGAAVTPAMLALLDQPTPPTRLPPPGALSGGNAGAGGQINLNGIQAGDATVYVVGGSGSQISSNANARLGLLATYVPAGAKVDLSGGVRAIDPESTGHVPATGPYTAAFVLGPTAAQFVRRSGTPEADQRFNNCIISGNTCNTFFIEFPLPTQIVEEVVIGIAGSALDDSSIVLVNQGNEEFLYDSDEQQRRRAGRGQ